MPVKLPKPTLMLQTPDRPAGIMRITAEQIAAIRLGTAELAGATARV